ncbi:MAG: polysaccharide deacetylase family protein [bacterium]
MKKLLVGLCALLIIGIMATPVFAATTLKKGDKKPVVKKVQEAPVPKGATILVYHTVEPKTDKKEGVMQKHYHILPENFRAQMRYLKDNGYAVIPMKIYLDHINKGTEIPKKSVVLTFDDGWKNQYDYAYPILKEFGYTATFYIITGSTDGKTYMSWDNIRELDKAGMDIESHTVTHTNLAKADEKKIADELTRSKKTLEEKLGHSISMLAYPYYGNNPVVQKLVAEAGYTSARAGWTKLGNTKDTLFMLKSQEAVNSTNPFLSKADK